MYQKVGQTLPLSYEKIYFSLWELSQRYGTFTDFRVIGKSHDERMIPLLEIGNGEEVCILYIRYTGNGKSDSRIFDKTGRRILQSIRVQMDGRGFL